MKIKRLTLSVLGEEYVELDSLPEDVRVINVKNEDLLDCFVPEGIVYHSPEVQEEVNGVLYNIKETHDIDGYRLHICNNLTLDNGLPLILYIDVNSTDLFIGNPEKAKSYWQEILDFYEGAYQIDRFFNLVL